MNIDEKTKELIYGTEGSKKINDLNEGLLAIELKHISFFKEKTSKYNNDEHDRLHNHYSYITNYNGITFCFNNDNDLNEEIKNECLNLFNSIFKE